ncbi:probable serine/threonine-protein kinase DDB_G0278509 [Bactrocera dorsalis]|uniref:Probable serine/threonine-protein kinase DDB_G0278509 n=1 Tax=Bactrocera dorsalis TaxID=27457 RepID=A0ABM3JVY2_BACDO|nr:probable serine/threonine-protein kinase DDB_G0278509 [Bactrocera dorsalis]XP_049313391.1 probable serine/threonine-protein kinase DDB_G0278509 [Bactrocera dorsalis]XP_049313392.1 probable serine/threonine-protein kinase DDB_G0278509 [Bactrocera dorsalis]XP_049313393.1 probable serine/threonine-protein kinase DDB_G0278509 [Bactrocera dorsalis]XP_049313394.1 probable serine/threonine-protein kinase DDB_G0278509 [Bactrocera dorsalis]XP_049313395.1 probable serine/threonine-protein kinase DDB_
MASFVYAVWSITNVASVHCAVRPELSPCTCEPIYADNYVELSCEKVDSFHKIVDALSNKFEPEVNISLKISHSQLEDLEMRSFMEMKLKLVKLRLQWNSLRSVPELPFRGLSNVEYLSIGDNELEEIPKHMLNHMPIVKTFDMGRCRIRSVLHDDLKGTQMVVNLFLPSNNIKRLDKGAFPTSLVTLHLGRNQIENLNSTLRHLDKLESLFINMNRISSLDDELPESNRLKLIMAQNNRLERLPESMRYMHKLENLHVQHNLIRTFDGIFKHARNLNEFHAFNNEIEYLRQDDFLECKMLEDIDFSVNHIKSLNSSLLPLSRLYRANISYNEIEEFSMNEIRGLVMLRNLILNNNRIKRLTGHQENNIDQNSYLFELYLDHNELKSLDGALMGLNSLRILSLSYNQLERILPEDFIGLAKLELLDLSHNQLLTLKEMERTFLPNLKILKAAYNNITRLEKDFHGLPVLCQANLTSNQISSISSELVSQTRCMTHNVPGKLELYLNDNPILCDSRLNELCPIMLKQETRIRGKSQCFEIDQEICTVLPMLFVNKYPLIIPTQLSQQVLANAKPVVIVPLLNPPLNNGDEVLPPLIAPIIKPILIAPLPPLATTTPSTTTTTTATTTLTTTAETHTGEQVATLEAPTSTLETNETGGIEDLTAGVGNINPGEGINVNANNTITAAPNTTKDKPNAVDFNNNTMETHAAEGDVTVDEKAPAAAGDSVSGIQATAAAHEGTLLTAHDISELTKIVGAPAVVAPPPTVLDEVLVGKPLPPETASLAPPTEYATVEYIPNLDEFLPGNRPPPNVLEEDSNSNSVHEEFPSVVLADLDNAPQSLLTPDEPPENP